MTRVIVSLWMTLDGFVAGLDDSMDWLRADADLMDYELDLVANAGALLLGRITHCDFASYWPVVAAGKIQSDEGNRRYARRLDELDKFVVSRSGKTASWSGTRIVPEITVRGIQSIKEQAAGDVIVYGSLSLIASLNRLDLIDEFDLVVHPTLLCWGKPILSAEEKPAQLELIECRPFSTGAVLLRYASTSTPAQIEGE